MEKVKFIKTELSEETLKALSIYDVSSSYSLMDEIRQKQLKCEENCIKQVIEQYTGKPLELKDAPKVMRAFHINDSSKYILAYDGVQLGMIRYINDGCNFTVEFTPNELKF